MPGVYQISLNLLESELKEAYDLGILAIMFFGVPNSKDDIGTGAYIHDGVIQQATRIPKKIAVLTASTGAAIRDIHSTINSRFPLA